MAKKKETLSFYKGLSILALVIAIVAIAQPYFKSQPLPQFLPISELSTEGYTKVDVQASVSENVGIVIVTGNCYQITATTEPSQAESIANGINGKVGFRPNTHDLVKDALENLDIDVVMVKIVDIQENTFIGRLILKQDDKIVSLDSRPSDGIALAVRTGAPIYIKDDLLIQQGRYIC